MQLHWPGKKSDPLEAQARSIDVEIARLEKEIARLNSRPAASAPSRATAKVRPAPRAVFGGQNFPEVESRQTPEPPIALPNPAVVVEGDARYNPQGIRKFDLLGFWNRLLRHFQAPVASNPRMVQYLAAGSVHGLRPLRYEKRVARNRFLGLFALLLVVLFGLAKVYFR